MAQKDSCVYPSRKVDVCLKHNKTGEIIFEKKGFEVPEWFSDRAANIVAEKYATDEEYSAFDVFYRIVNQIAEWGVAQGYFDIGSPSDKFKADLMDILVNQRACFNSPVLFNVGVPHHQPQVSACYILPIEDSIEDIFDHTKREALIFKWGSGAGSNVSKLRGRGEPLSNNGVSSGTLSFMRGWDRFAGAIKSGGRNRRSAKLICMDIDHPDIEEFISCKTPEENKIRLLMNGGFSYEEASDTVSFQNTNHSVRVTDDFMKCVKYDYVWSLVNRGEHSPAIAKDLQAKDLLMQVAEHTWHTGDPGIQYHDRMNLDNPVPQLGEIVSTNPCLAGETRLHTLQGLKRIEDLVDKDFEILCHDGVFRKATAFPNGTKKIYKVTLSSGNELLCTEDHRLLESRKTMEFVEAQAVDSKVELGFLQEGYCKTPNIDYMEYQRAILLGYATGDGTPKRIQDKKTYGVHNARIYLRKDGDDNEVGDLFKATFIDWKEPKDSQLSISSKMFTIFWDEYEPEPFVQDRFIPQEILEGDLFLLGAFLKGLFSANGSVQPKYNRVSLKTTSKRLGVEVINALSMIGIHSYMTTNKKKSQEFSNGTYEMRESYDINISKKENLKNFMNNISFVQSSKKNKLIEAIETSPKSTGEYRRPSIKLIEFVREDTVYDFTEKETHTGVANGIVVHNCSEFSAVDNSSCNLSSMNLVKYLKKSSTSELTFDFVAFERDINVMVTAMDIMVEPAHYPTEDIGRVTRSTRPLGLGFTNLGGLLMRMGLPYDSDKGRELAASITQEMTTYAYETSIDLARKLGSFSAYSSENFNSIEDFINRGEIGIDEEHWNDFEHTGIRNSQLTLLAPAGCLTGDSLVLSSEGLLPIVELGNIKGDEWQDINININQENEVAHSNKFYINGEAPVVEITTRRGHSIKSTLKHKFRVLNTEGDYVWKPAGDIKEGDYVATRLGGHEQLLGNKEYQSLIGVDITHPNSTKLILPEKLDEEFAEVLGYFMGDGWTKVRGGLHLIADSKDRDLSDYFNAWATKIGGHSTIEDRDRCFVWNLFSYAIRPWFKLNGFAKALGNHGEGSFSANIPTKVLKSRTSVLCSFLRGLFEADGTVSIKDSRSCPIIEFSTVSPTLAKQLLVALESLGIATNLSKYNTAVGSFGDRTKYRVRVASVIGAIIFYEKIGFLSNRKKSILQTGVGNVKDFSDKSKTIKNKALIDEFYELAKGLPCEIRADICARKRQVMFNLNWAARIITTANKLDAENKLKDSKIASLLELSSNLIFAQVTKVSRGKIEPTYDISVPHNNTYVVNSFISHNTISFVMDCDSTGIEPLIALESYKTLVGGEVMRIVPDCIKEGVNYLRSNYAEHCSKYDEDIIEDCPDVFATAGTLSSDGHMLMMAACQPHLNGAVSKTLNLPNDATVQDIYDIYVKGHELGLKALAVYRDGSKAFQPVSTTKSTEVLAKEKKAPEEPSSSPEENPVISLSNNKIVNPRTARVRLPDERESKTHKFSIVGHEGYLTVGMYPDGSPGEMFIKMQKEGSLMSGLMDSFAVAISLMLQYGVPLEHMVEKFKGSKFDPQGITQNPDIVFADSIIDYLFKWMEKKFIEVPEDKLVQEEIAKTLQAKPAKSIQYGDPCVVCGSLTIKAGTCSYCSNCGASSGCS